MTAGDYPEESTKNGENVVTKQRQDTDKNTKYTTFRHRCLRLEFNIIKKKKNTQNTDTQTDKKDKEKEERDQKKMDT